MSGDELTQRRRGARPSHLPPRHHRLLHHRLYDPVSTSSGSKAFWSIQLTLALSALALSLVVSRLNGDSGRTSHQSDHVEELHVGREWMETQL